MAYTGIISIIQWDYKFMLQSNIATWQGKLASPMRRRCRPTFCVNKIIIDIIILIRHLSFCWYSQAFFVFVTMIWFGILWFWCQSGYRSSSLTCNVSVGCLGCFRARRRHHTSPCSPVQYIRRFTYHIFIHFRVPPSIISWFYKLLLQALGLVDLVLALFPVPSIKSRI